MREWNIADMDENLLDRSSPQEVEDKQMYYIEWTNNKTGETVEAGPYDSKEYVDRLIEESRIWAGVAVEKRQPKVA